MGIKDVVRAEKNVASWGEWKVGVKMPASAFPLSKQRRFSIRACYRWRVAQFTCDDKQYRLLVAYRPELLVYRAYLGLHEDGDTCVIARYEYHSTHEGWHIHTNCHDNNEIFGRTGNLASRLPESKSVHRRLAFGIDNDEQAFFVAAKVFGLIKKQVLSFE